MAAAKLYGFELSHPTQMARVMLELKGVEYELVNLPTGLHPVALRMCRFRGGTVPALRLDGGRRVQRTRAIARVLDELVPEPRLAFDDRPEWVSAETWADEVFQNVPRQIVRRLAVHSTELRRWIAQVGGMPMPGVTAKTSGLLARRLASMAGASEENVRATLAELPATMDRVDALLTDGTARSEPPDALALQLVLTTKTLLRYPELAVIFKGRPSTALAEAIDVPLPGSSPVALPPEWVAAAVPT